MLMIFRDLCRSISVRCFAKGAGRFVGWRFRAKLRTSPSPTIWCLNFFPRIAACGAGLNLPASASSFKGCRRGYGERARFGLAINELVKKGTIKAPIVIGRDHLDCGSVASPFRETESMKDGSDAVADWPLLNALVNTAAGASWVSIHNGGGVGIGYSLHAGQVTVADGTDAMAKRIERVLTTDPGMGIIRHADAGYEEARGFAAQADIRIPMAPT